MEKLQIILNNFKIAYANLSKSGPSKLSLQSY